ncbi:MAG: hypothetical protein A2513_08195 [Sulfurimonas sp. RIFOXYD12_FULL_33_39]|uniref:hypothetical protein n=1 Tax=unclassified Sulfurimonas TaxID=2623549 RepID=UPI0008BBBEED|nr:MULTISPECIES: hypothetical protein [unclassified Sulfurimonas]OHE10068.1 MAG: hypothetical protein A2513_08195 [Sulfurimonas sp. RIFOXYD12_FULL_33_39]OHE14711.1 MAG: hypothetical protein A2530_02285 [Sulfurimonas sp. RIFOXYD2_FULL_34_21]
MYKLSNFFSSLVDKLDIMRKRRQAYIIGSRAALGKNIYLTFGSQKTVTKNAQESYIRYSTAYDQECCDKEYFIKGYDEMKVKIQY